MVRVDTVYQRVLALVNKEQRGYITPQEFNLFAGHAQSAIFEQYFYDFNQFGRMPGSTNQFSDMTDILKEKIAIFKQKDTLQPIGQPGAYYYPNNMYRLGTVFAQSYGYLCEVEPVTDNELLNMNKSYLAKPTDKRPVYTIDTNGIHITPISGYTNVSATYIRKPMDPNWTYTVVGDKALYNGSALDHQDFELHESEEASLVLKILALAGIELQSPELYQTAGQEDVKNIQQEKA